jgi:hypothetical protein
MKLQEIAHKNTIEVIRDELDKIADKSPDGMVTAESVVDVARHPDSPLHKHFTWDDGEAADKYRLLEARTLIRRVRVLPSDGADAKSVQKYVSLMKDRQREGGGYRQTSDVIADKSLLAELEATAKTELQGWVDRHAALSQLTTKVARAAGLPAKAQRANPRKSR